MQEAVRSDALSKAASQLVEPLSEPLLGTKFTTRESLEVAIATSARGARNHREVHLDMSVQVSINGLVMHVFAPVQLRRKRERERET